MSDNVVARLRALLAESAEARWEPAFSQEYESIEDVIAWVAESFSQRPDHMYLGVVQSEVPAADGGAGLLAITGNGTHSLAHAVLIAGALNALPALLDVVDDVAHAGLNNAHLYCPFCGGDHMFDTVGGYQHVPDCPWLAARRLCGMDGDA